MSEQQYAPIDALFDALDGFTDEGLAHTWPEELVHMAEIRYGQPFNYVDMAEMRDIAREELDEHREELQSRVQGKDIMRSHDIFRRGGLAEYTNGPDNSTQLEHPHDFIDYESAVLGAGAIALIGSDPSGNDAEFNISKEQQ